MNKPTKPTKPMKPIYNNCIIVIGQNRNGDLGLNHTKLVHKLTEIDNRSFNIKNIHCGNGHTIYCNHETQQFYATGDNSYRQCGVCSVSTQPLKILTEIKYFHTSNIIIKKVFTAIKGKCTFWLTNDNKLYANGINVSGKYGLGIVIQQLHSASINSTEPQLICTNISNIIDVQPASDYTIILSHLSTDIIIHGWIRRMNDNKLHVRIPVDIINLIQLFFGVISKVYSTTSKTRCGGNGHGSCNFLDYILSGSKFKEIEILKNKQIISIKTGLDHSLFLESNGIVWCCGDHRYGQLGSKYVSQQNEPTQIKYFTQNKIKIKNIVCGGHHSFAIDYNHKIYSWGWNGCGQCGHGTRNNIILPKLIEALKNYEIKSAQCGESHSYVMTQDDKHFLFGSNRNNECITNEVRSDILLPHLINKLFENDKGIRSINIGKDNTKILYKTEFL